MSETAAEAVSARDAVQGPMGRRRFWTAVVLCVVGIAILVNLGLWQVDRLRWKETILQTIDSRVNAAPIGVGELARIADETGDVEYVPAFVRGRFLHEGERFFLSTRSGQAGWNVHTPLLVDGTSDAVFVNRGFVPYTLKDPATRPDGQVEGTVEITGLARNAQDEKPGDFTPDNDPTQNAFFWRNLEEMSKGLFLPEGTRLLPFVIDAGAGETPGGYPVGGTTVVAVPNNHLQYAITWFSLAAVMAVMLAILVVSQARRQRASTG